MQSITPRSRRSSAEIFIASAASVRLSRLRQRMSEQDSGLITEYQAFSSMRIWSPTPMPSAPPLAPSPIIATTMGTGSRAISKRLRAMASDMLRCSEARPGNAPGVSTIQSTGRPNLAANCINLRALRYPSGCGRPKLRLRFSLVLRPFCCPITTMGWSSKYATPPIIARSFPLQRSPCNSIKSEVIRSI